MLLLFSLENNNIICIHYYKERNRYNPITTSPAHKTAYNVEYAVTECVYVCVCVGGGGGGTFYAVQHCMPNP